MSEIVRQFEEERDLEIMAAIDAGEAFLDIAERFCVSEEHVQAIWESMCATDPEGEGHGFAPLLIVPLAILAWVPVFAVIGLFHG
ncbi:MAG TPA: hypothetical protein DCL54_03275 [Alphaproteobacteria bacterium]|nr:hypothetical protein [Alphaproteobacteria bacterium]